jgi:hypothetical protein
MLDALKSAIDLALHGQASRLVNFAESYKRRTLAEIKQQTVSAGITIALVATGLAFLLVSVTIALAALFYWVALWHGTLAGLCAAGAAAMSLALVLIGLAAWRPKGSSRVPPVAALSPQRYPTAASSHFDPSDAAALGKKSVDAATGILRDGSREAVIATLAATIVIGMLIGRRR